MLLSSARTWDTLDLSPSCSTVRDGDITRARTACKRRLKGLVLSAYSKCRFDTLKKPRVNISVDEKRQQRVGGRGSSITHLLPSTLANVDRRTAINRFNREEHVSRLTSGALRSTLALFNRAGDTAADLKKRNVGGMRIERAKQDTGSA